MRFRSIASAAVLALGLAAVPTLSAQTPGTPPPGGQGQRGGAGRMQAMALQGITLTAVQQAKVDSITAKTRAQMPAVTPGTPPSDADRAKIRSLSMASVQEVRTVLTPDQQAIYDKNVAQMQQMMQQRMQGGPPPAAPAKPE
jgi:Spy/CpxP family protein refolding chaperone